MSTAEVVIQGYCDRCGRSYWGEHQGCDPILRLSDLRVIAEQMQALVKYLAAEPSAGRTAPTQTGDTADG